MEAVSEATRRRRTLDDERRELSWEAHGTTDDRRPPAVFLPGATDDELAAAYGVAGWPFLRARVRREAAAKKAAD